MRSTNRNSRHRVQGAFGKVLHLSQGSEALGFKSAMPGRCFAEPLQFEEQSEPVPAGWAKSRLPVVVYVHTDISRMLT